MEPVYPNLRAEIAKRGIKIKAIAAYLRISEKALSNKINGKTDFTWPEACKISNCFFPDVDKDSLFSKNYNDTA